MKRKIIMTMLILSTMIALIFILTNNFILVSDTKKIEKLYRKNEEQKLIETYDTQITLLEQQKVLKKESPNQVLEKFDKKQNFLLYFGRNNCPYCQQIITSLGNSLKESEKTIIYIDTNSKKQENFQELIDKFQIEEVPSIVRVENKIFTSYRFEEDNLYSFIK